MATTIEYVLMAGHAYQTTRDEINWIPVPQGWTPFLHVPDPDIPSFPATSGFEAVSFQRGNEIVISYTGTDPGDLLGDIAADIGLAVGVGASQLLQAAEYYLQVQAANPTATITFTGHSLGGGLAALMGVFFGKRAVTFDQAPFANSAELNVLTPNVAANLKTDLLARGYSEAVLQGLADFIQLREVTGGIPNSSLIDSINVQGEFLSGVPWNIPDRIGISVNIPNSAPGVSGGDLHSQALLTAFVQSIQTATPQQALHEVTFKLTDLMGMIFSRDLYLFDTDTSNPNFLERLVRHEAGVRDPITGVNTTAADAMVTRFTSDLWKLAQDGGLTMTDNIPGGIFSSPPNNVSKALTAFAMQKYYNETQTSAGYNKELFTDLATANIGSGGVHFDRADVADTLGNAKGYTLYFQNYLDSSAFSSNERQLIQSLLPTLRDWYVQAGAGGMNVVDSKNRGAFMLGGAGADTLTGGTQADLLVGNASADQLNGGAGTDRLLGGAGNDILEGGTENDILDGGLDNDILKGGEGLDRYISNFGADTIEDSDNRGVVEFDNKVLLSGLRRTDDPTNVFRSADGTITLTKSGADLVVTGSGPLTVKNFSSGQLGIRLIGEAAYAPVTRETFLKTVPDPNNPSPATIQVAFFDESNNHSNNLEDPLTDDTNNFIHALGGADTIISGAGDDHLYGDGGTDEIYGGLGNDRLYGGGEDDQLFGDNVAVSTSGGNDFLDGGEGNDLVQGGAGRDVVFGGAGNDNLNGDESAGDNSGGFDDYLDGEAGDDELHGAAGSDVLIGGVGNDLLIGDTTQFQNGTPEQGGNDSLDGGEGQDQLFGLYGDDLLSGGAGNDLVNGQDGSDVLYGGAGDDALAGDLRFTSLAGGYDTREYRAAGAADLLFGEAGADLLSGGEGNDVVDGGTENDTLAGDYVTSQISTSEPLYWTLFSAPGDDWISGGTGNDSLAGGFGTDVLLGGDGSDSLLGGAGDDHLEGGAGDDVLYGEYLLTASEFVLNPFVSTIRALSGNDLLDGGDGNDDLDGGKGDDTLLGGAGNDSLSGGSGNDVLDGGAGVDRLDGGDGMDLVHAGAGNDRLTDFQGGDTLYGDEGDDFLSSGLELLPSGEGGEPIPATGDSTLIGGLGNDTYEIDGLGDVVVEAAGEGIDMVNSYISSTLSDYFENLTLQGLTLTGVGNSINNVLTGGLSLDGLAGDDTLNGVGRLNGGAGDDLLQGRSGVSFFNEATGSLQYLANTYVFRAGDGHDRIQDNDAALNSAPNQNEDTLSFEAGVVPSDVTWGGTGNDLVLTYNGGVDQITISSFYDLRLDRGGYLLTGAFVPPQGSVFTPGGGLSAYVAPSRVELVQFADGTVWHADHFGAPLLGDFHADTYGFGRGSGEVTVLDLDVTQSNVNREQDRIVIGADVMPNEVTVARVNGDDLVLSINGTGDRLTVQSFFKTITAIPPFSFSGYSVAAYRIEQVQFTDGTLWTVTDLFNRLSTFVGTSGPDTLFGNQNDNLIQGLGGDDFLSGQAGDDVLDGGAGNDRMFGDAGNDTYIFNLGDGVDTIYDEVVSGEPNRILFGPGITVANLAVAQSGTTLTITVGSNGDSILLEDFDPFNQDGSLVVSTLEFADGSAVNLADLFPSNHAPTVATPLANQTVPEDAPFTVEVPSNTFVDEDAGDPLTLSASLADGSALPVWLSFNATPRTFTGTPDDAQVGAIDLRVTATDTGNLSVSDTFTLTVTNVNEVPTVTSPLADQTAAEDSPFSFTVPGTTFTDPDQIHGDGLTYSAAAANGSTLPAWLSFNSTTRTFSGTPGGGDAGTLHISVTATDTGALSATATFALVISGPLPRTVIGTAGNDVLSGGRGDDTLSGLAGNDTLNGGQGHDLLDGGTGTDTMRGGTGNDTYIVDVAGDVVAELANEGIDTVLVAISYQLSANVENLTLTGTAAINGTGNALDNILTGNSAANSLTGGAGNDTYVVGTGDSVVENFNSGTDTVQSSVTFTLGSNLENLTLTGTENINGTGNSANNVLVGNSGNNTLDGVSGNDTVDGGAGDDNLLGGSGDDQLLGGLGNDILNAGSGRDVLNGGNGTDTLDGGAGDDQLLGGAGNDAMTGGSGADQFTGGTGNDTLTGGSGSDLYNFSRGDGQDTIDDADSFPFNQDRALFGATINPLDLVISRQTNDLRLAIHGSSDQITVQNWYLSANNRIETIQAGNSRTLLSTKVDQLIQAMASFSQQSGLTWDQAIDQQPQQVQAVLAGSWQ